MVTAAMKFKKKLAQKKSYDKPGQHIKKQRHHFTNKDPSSHSYGFSSSHVWMWELEYKESWAPKSWCFWTVVLEKTFESPLDSRRFNQSILQEISPEYSLEGVMLKLKLQYFGHLMRRTESLEKDPDAGKDWRPEKGTTEDEMVGWHQWLDGREFEQAPGDGEGQGSLAAVHGVSKSWTWLSNWTTTTEMVVLFLVF